MKTTLLITFGKTERNMVFICCCLHRSACITCSWLPCSFFFYVKRRERLCVYLAWLVAFGDPSFSDLRFFVSLKFSITFFPMPSAVSLSSCLEEESASANHPERFHFPFSSSLIFFVNFFLKSIHLSLTALLSLSWNFGESIPFSVSTMASYTRPRSRLPFFTTNTFPADILVIATHHTPWSTPFAWEKSRSGNKSKKDC